MKPKKQVRSDDNNRRPLIKETFKDAQPSDSPARLPIKSEFAAHARL